jgi:hypothetical protein
VGTGKEIVKICGLPRFFEETPFSAGLMPTKTAQDNKRYIAKTFLIKS